ncbi:MAG: isochorismate synthase [Ignavibacteriaceae bacterium]|nr:isochorismate synthase [Ignavibacteriaceae bacterium]
MKINSEIILKDFSAFTKTFEKITEQHLITYSFPLKNFDSLTVMDQLNEFCDDIFFFRIPENKLTITGLNSALELASGESNHFYSVNDQFNYWKKNYSTNWNGLNFSSLPTICCTAKFDPSKSSSLWNDFESLRIYIPEFIFSCKDGQTIGVYNFILHNKQSLEEISSGLSFYLKKVEELKEKPVEELNPKIRSTLNTSEEEVNSWKQSFNKALQILNAGEVDKLVLSRMHGFTLYEPINWTILLDKLTQRFNDCYLFFTKRKSSFFFGSSPEMFLKVSSNIAEVESVAGSAPRGEVFETDQQFERLLQTSEKNRREHLFVSEFISEILIHYSDNVRIIEEKQIRKLNNIQHLVTRISAELNSKNKLFDLIDSLYPTPAVCGVPKELALNSIRKLEVHDRGLYSGLIGLMNFEGECELAVTIRSALVKNNTVMAFAGAGLVKDSNSDDEFFETNLKLYTILSLFSNENKCK